MKLRETIMKIVFLIAACCSLLAVALICIFLFMNGVPAIFKIGPLKFLTGTMSVSYTHLDVYKRQR